MSPNLEAVVAKKYETWNTALSNATEQFAKDHPDATVLLFSSFEAFDALLSNPEEHGFDPKDVTLDGGSIWMDHLHPTSKVHDHIARRIATFLESVRPTPKDNADHV